MQALRKMAVGVEDHPNKKSPAWLESLALPALRALSAAEGSAAEGATSKCQGNWWARLDSNQGPTDYESAALTAELRARTSFSILHPKGLLDIGHACR